MEFVKHDPKRIEYEHNGNIQNPESLNLSCETTPKWHSFFFDQTGRCSGQRRRSYATQQGRSLFFDQTGRFGGQRLGAEPRTPDASRQT
jgi:hypothetical protein